jgi:hypothetical protein
LTRSEASTTQGLARHFGTATGRDGDSGLKGSEGEPTRTEASEQSRLSMVVAVSEVERRKEKQIENNHTWEGINCGFQRL